MSKQDRRVVRAIDGLARRFEEGFPEKRPALRKVGREAEFPVVHPDGRAADVLKLWGSLREEEDFRPVYDGPRRSYLVVALRGKEFSYEIEVGRGTIEIILPPAEDLFRLQRTFERAIRLLARVARKKNVRVLGYGIQPVTPRSARLMAPKQRYYAMLDAMGPPWLHFTTGASDQLHVDLCRSEVVKWTNWMNLLSGPIIALTAHSSVYGGRIGQFRSGREGLQLGMGKERHGMPPRPFRDVADFIGTVVRHSCFILPERKCFRPFGHPFVKHLALHGADFEAYLWHEHYVWPSARPRVAYGTLEIRPACQQPPEESWAACALELGLAEAVDKVADYAESALWPDPWEAMMRYRGQAVRRGLSAPEPAPGFLRTLLELAEDGLRRRGRAEERLLRPLWRRWERRTEPALDARKLWQSGGVGALVGELSF